MEIKSKVINEACINKNCTIWVILFEKNFTWETELHMNNLRAKTLKIKTINPVFKFLDIHLLPWKAKAFSSQNQPQQSLLQAGEAQRTHCKELIWDVDTVAGSGVHMTNPLSTGSGKCQRWSCVSRDYVFILKNTSNVLAWSKDY